MKFNLDDFLQLAVNGGSGDCACYKDFDYYGL